MDWLEKAQKRINSMTASVKEVKVMAENELYFFAKLVNPGYVYGSVHQEIFRWMQDYTLFIGNDEGISSNKLIMLPRAHLKSHMMATWCAWMIVRHPEITILYVSATADLAEQQLMAVKNILESAKFQRYWPEYINPEVGKREKWTSSRIIIDHPKRKEEGIRDATVSTAGLTTNTTGWHADIIIPDDLVVPENAYTEDGRESVSKKSSQFTSIRNAGGFTMACGTRYHPSDIYAVWKEQIYDVYNEDGVLVDRKPVWEVKEFGVEEDGIFIWPRTVRQDGKAFGFNWSVLSRIKAEYSDRVQFFAQYYNNPNDPGSDRISRDKFQYYDQRHLKKEGGRWFYKGNRLNIYAAVDFAFSLSKQADYTAIVVIGIDSDSNIYVLDIERFKTDKIIDYFNKVKELHSRWSFKKLQAEVSVAQKVIVEDIKRYVKKDGLRLSVIEYRPTRTEGNKEERIAANLEHRYDDYKMWHFEGGWTQILEEELVLARPPHDDIKDALASAVSITTPPSSNKGSSIGDFLTGGNNLFNKRFGGVA